jgi:chromosome segregation ATPase
MDAQEFIDKQLQHAYDPLKSHDYYLRTRKLKGRKKGSERPAAGRNNAATKLTTPRKTSTQKREETKARVEAIKNRLERLKEVLAQLVDEAKARSGIETKPASAKKAEPDKSPAKEKPKSAQDKKEEAKKARDQYQKEHKQTPNQELESLQTQLKSVEEKIQKARATLKDSVNKARQQIPISNTPSKTTDGNGNRHH